MLKVCTTFSGYDSQCMALDLIGIPYDLVAWCEIDQHAIKAHNAIYPQLADRNLGDITLVDWKAVPDFDLFTYSSPCQDFSSAGLQKGGVEGTGTRSSLLWECRKAIEEKRPKYLLMENVAALNTKKFARTFGKWLNVLSELRYKNYVKVINSRNYDVPQNRPRVFVVSVLDCQTPYYFPKPKKKSVRFYDLLQSNVSERYFVPNNIVERMGKWNTQVNPVKEMEKMERTQVCNCLMARGQYDINASMILVRQDGGVRRLTERECFRLMGVKEDNITKILKAGIHIKHLYEMAGNSIVVDVLAAIFKNLLITTTPPEGTQTQLF